MYNVVLCQQGLQFFPDRLKALGEMRRVLVSGGRVAVSVWTGPSPYFVAMREGLARYVARTRRSAVQLPSLLATPPNFAASSRPQVSKMSSFTTFAKCFAFRHPRSSSYNISLPFRPRSWLLRQAQKSILRWWLT